MTQLFDDRIYEPDQIEPEIESQSEDSDIKSIKDEFNIDRSNLEKQIEQIILIEQKLNLIIYDLESANDHVKTILQNEKDPQKKKNLYNAISFNVEKLTNLYSVVRQYQDTKHKYFATISDLTVKKNKMLYVDLKDSKKGLDDSYLLFNKLVTILNGDHSAISPDNKNINEIDDYKM